MKFLYIYNIDESAQKEGQTKRQTKKYLDKIDLIHLRSVKIVGMMRVHGI